MTTAPLAPMGARSTALHFGVPATLMVAAFWGVRPALEGIGLAPLPAYLLAVAAPLAGLLVATVAGCCVIERLPLQGDVLRARLRFERPVGEDWQAMGAAVALSVVASLALAAAVTAAVRNGLVPVPDSLPAFLDPRHGVTSRTLDRAVGGDISGRWEIAGLFLVVVALNIVAEELWWRGYVLPRQEVAFGDRAWVVHGALWAGFHVFKWWDVMTLLPAGLILSRACQRRRSSWPGVGTHVVLNALGPITVLAAVAS